MLSVLYNSNEKSLLNIKLTPRGKEIFLLIIQGYNYKEIGYKLGITDRCVKYHREKILELNNCSEMRELMQKYYSIDK